MDLLEHERLVTALDRALVVPVELDDLVLDRRAVGGAQEARPLGRHDRDLAVVRELHDARLPQKRRRVGRDVGLALGEAHDHRALEPGADEHAGVVAVDRDEREVPLELAIGQPDGLDEVAVVVLLDEVCDGLGVGLGREDVTVLEEALAELAVVLDDAVQHDRELLGLLGGERMRVLLGHAPMGRPARVAEPRGRRRGMCPGTLT